MFEHLRNCKLNFCLENWAENKITAVIRASSIPKDYNLTFALTTANMRTFNSGYKVWSGFGGKIQQQHKLKYMDTVARAHCIH